MVLFQLRPRQVDAGRLVSAERHSGLCHEINQPQCRELKRPLTFNSRTSTTTTPIAISHHRYHPLSSYASSPSMMPMAI